MYGPFPYNKSSVNYELLLARTSRMATADSNSQGRIVQTWWPVLFLDQRKEEQATWVDSSICIAFKCSRIFLASSVHGFKLQNFTTTIEVTRRQMQILTHIQFAAALNAEAASEAPDHDRSRSVDQIPLLSDVEGSTGIDGGARDVAKERKIGEMPAWLLDTTYNFLWLFSLGQWTEDESHDTTMRESGRYRFRFLGFFPSGGFYWFLVLEVVEIIYAAAKKVRIFAAKPF